MRIPDWLNIVIGFAVFILAFLPIRMSMKVLYSLDRAAQWNPASVRYSLIDFLGLTFLVPFPFVLINLCTGGIDDEQTAVMIYVLSTIVSTLIWWTAVRVFSRAGISDAKPRSILVLFVLPMTYFGSFSIGFLTLMAYFAEFPDNVYALIAVLVLWTGLILARALTRSIVKSAKSNSAISDGF